MSRPAAEEYAAECRSIGLKVLAIIARESGMYVLKNADMYQIGNEMDHSGPSSWTMDAAEHDYLWSVFHGYPRVMGGFVSGIPEIGVDYWQPDCTRIAVHPYNKDPEQARALIRRYKELFPSCEIWITEWNRPADQMAAFIQMMKEEGVAAAFWFCWSHGMVDGFGLEGKEQIIKEAQDVAEFILGFKAKADELGEEIVGQPVEDEHYWPDGTTSMQMTTKGFMIYSKASNQVGFVPFAKKS